MTIRNRGSNGMVETPKQVKQRKKSTRRVIFLSGAVMAIGVGAYFGSKKSMVQILKSIEGSEKHLSRLVEYTYFLEGARRDNLEVIDKALNAGIPFTHYPGIGVHSFEMDKLRQPIVETVKKTKK